MREVAPVNEQEPVDLPLQPLIARLASEARALAAALRPVAAVTELLVVPDDCLPAHCDQALIALKGLHAPADCILHLLKQPGRYPPMLALNRFDLLASLRYLETKSVEAEREIGRFRLVCQDWNPQTTHQRMAIRRRLEMLMEVGSEVSERILRLFEASPVPTHPTAHTKRLI
jgi:hypothetical protein